MLNRCNFLTIYLTFFTILGLTALDKRDLIFYTDFKSGAKAEKGGNCQGKITGKVQFIPTGKVPRRPGRVPSPAAKFTRKGDYISYPVKGNINLPQGTVMLWVYELDTEAKQRVWNPFFQMKSKSEVFNILRFWQPMRYGGGLWRRNNKTAVLGVGAPEVPGHEKNAIPPRQWLQIVFSWRGHAASIYINGKLYDSLNHTDFRFLNQVSNFTVGRVAKPTAQADDFHTGEHLIKDAPKVAKRMKIGTEPYGAYLIDEVAVFNRFIGPKEAEILYKKSLKKALSSGVKDKGKIALHSFVSRRRIKADVDFGQRLPAGTHARLRIDGTKLEKTVKLRNGGFDYCWFDVSSLKPGKYSISAVAEKNGRVLASAPKADFELSEPEAWMTNTYGKADVVLPGFEPLKVQGKKIKVWGRTYDFSSGPMPYQITSQGREMLQRPVNWFVKTNGKIYSLQMSEFKLTSVKDTRARFKGKGRLGKLAVTVEVMVEYDGFMKFRILFEPAGKGVVVEKLYMDIPFKPEQSTLMYYHTRTRAFWDNKWHSYLKLPVMGVMTFGTADIILQWMTESDQYYYPVGDKFQLSTFTHNKAHVFRTSVIGAKKLVNKKIDLIFALQAGPVKARPDNWRSWTMKGRKYLIPGKHKDIQYKYFQQWWSRTPGCLIPRLGYDDKRLVDRIDGTSLHFAGFRHFMAKKINDVLPEWKKYREEWERDPASMVTQGTAPGWNNTFVDTNSSWGQWHIYNAYKLFSKTKMRGLYYDDWYPGVSKNQAAGSGYIDEKGMLRPTYPLFSQREIHRRIYAIVKKFRPKDGIVIIHTSGLNVLPIVAFCDVTYDGEILGWTQFRPPKGNYFDTYHLDLLRILFSGRQYGPVPAFHDMTRTYIERNVKDMGKIMLMPNQRKLWALWLLHDIHAYGGFTSGAEELLYMYLDQAFPLTDEDVKFHPYWDKAPAVKVQSAYFKSGNIDRASKFTAVAYSKHGSALIVVACDAPNNYSGYGKVKLLLDRKKLGLKAGKLEAFSLESLGRAPMGKIDGDVLTVPVKYDDFSAVIVKAASKQQTFEH